MVSLWHVISLFGEISDISPKLIFFIIFRKLDFCRHFENIKISDPSRDFTSQVWKTDCQVKIIREKRTKFLLQIKEKQSLYRHINVQEKHFGDDSIF